MVTLHTDDWIKEDYNLRAVEKARRAFDKYLKNILLLRKDF